MKQNTIYKKVSLSGVGLHSGKTTNLRFLPAQPNTGIIFKRTDLKSPVFIKAKTENGITSPLCTTIQQNKTQVKTIEHLMAAISVLRIDNLIVEIDNEEIPILDGSSKLFYKRLAGAGVRQQNALKSCIKILKPISVTEDGKKAFILPSEDTKYSFFIDFDHKAIGRQECHWNFDQNTFNKWIAPARTFGFESDVQKLKELGLAKGGSLNNAILLGENGRVLNDTGLRFRDEFVRHKLLDSIGDLALAGSQIIGHYYGIKSSHALNHRLLEALFESPDAWKVVYNANEERFAA